MQHFLGAYFNPSVEYAINNTKTQTSYSTDFNVNNEWQSLQFDFELITEDFINVDNWKSIVLRRMIGTLTLSILIFILVLILLYYSIKNLINQKKIADIKTDFINNITHEFKTPLATLALATKMLEKEEVKNEIQTLDTTIKTINRQSNRLQKLIDQVIDNSLGAKDIQLSKTNIKIGDYLNNILDDFLLSTEGVSLALIRNIDTNPIAQVDRFYFTTALINILENAMKYTSKIPKIHFKLTTTSTHFTIVISDNGIGISEVDKTQIFNKFFRADQSEIHNVKGLGLGLFYTNEIVTAHGGDISIESQKEKGSTFKITVPLTL